MATLQEATQGMVGEKVSVTLVCYDQLVQGCSFDLSLNPHNVNAPAGFAKLRLNYIQNGGLNFGKFGGGFGHCLAKFSPL